MDGEATQYDEGMAQSTPTTALAPTVCRVSLLLHDSPLDALLRHQVAVLCLDCAVLTDGRRMKPPCPEWPILQSHVDTILEAPPPGTHGGPIWRS